MDVNSNGIESEEGTLINNETQSTQSSSWKNVKVNRSQKKESRKGGNERRIERKDRKKTKTETMKDDENRARKL